MILSISYKRPWHRIFCSYARERTPIFNNCVYWKKPYSTNNEISTDACVSSSLSQNSSKVASTLSSSAFVPSPSLILELRQKTFFPLNQCKRALIETKGNLEDAITWLKYTSLNAYEASLSATSINKNGTESSTQLLDENTGFISFWISSDHKSAHVFQAQCRTSFGANSDTFKSLCVECVSSPHLFSMAESIHFTKYKADKNMTLESLISMTNKDDFKTRLSETIALLREPIDINLALKFPAEGNELIFGYCHPPTFVSPSSDFSSNGNDNLTQKKSGKRVSLGKIMALLKFKYISGKQDDKYLTIDKMDTTTWEKIVMTGEKVCQQIAATTELTSLPEFLSSPCIFSAVEHQNSNNKKDSDGTYDSPVRLAVADFVKRGTNVPGLSGSFVVSEVLKINLRPRSSPFTYWNINS